MHWLVHLQWLGSRQGPCPRRLWHTDCRGQGFEPPTFQISGQPLKKVWENLRKFYITLFFMSSVLIKTNLSCNALSRWNDLAYSVFSFNVTSNFMYLIQKSITTYRVLYHTNEAESLKPTWYCCPEHICPLRQRTELLCGRLLPLPCRISRLRQNILCKMPDWESAQPNPPINWVDPCWVAFGMTPSALGLKRPRTWTSAGGCVLTNGCYGN